MNTERYLTEKQVSEMTGLALATLRNKRYFGEEPTYIKVGRSVRYALSDIVNFMESKKIMPRQTKIKPEGDKLQ